MMALPLESFAGRTRRDCSAATKTEKGSLVITRIKGAVVCATSVGGMPDADALHILEQRIGINSSFALLLPTSPETSSSSVSRWHLKGRRADSHHESIQLPRFGESQKVAVLTPCS